jgi:hypothetical protein
MMMLALHALYGIDPGRVAPVAFVVHAVTEDVAIDARQADEIGFQVRPPREGP